jgi:hypothetical protein
MGRRPEPPPHSGQLSEQVLLSAVLPILIDGIRDYGRQNLGPQEGFSRLVKPSQKDVQERHNRDLEAGNQGGNEHADKLLGECPI